MSPEHFFRLLSIALLGLIGLVAMPNEHVEPVRVEAVQATTIHDDVQAAMEVNQINSDRLKPYIIEEDSVALQADLDDLEVQLMASTHQPR